MRIFRFKRRTKIIGAALLTTLIVSAIYSYFIEPYRIHVTTYSLTDRQRPIRIVQLSDFHVEDDNGLDRVRRAIAITKDHRPDLIVITGDFITDFVYSPSGYLDLLKELPKIAPTYAIGGNHDGGVWSGLRGGYQTTDPIKQFLRPSGILYLENQTDTLSLRGRKLEIYGSGDLWARKATHDTEAIFSTSPNSLKIVLTHNPDSKFLFMNDPWDLMFSGHTHGGQVVIPFLGAPRVPINNKRYTRGHFAENNQHFIVSAGIGCLHGFRFNSVPEVVVVEF